MEVFKYKGIIANGYFIKDNDFVYAVDTGDIADEGFFLKCCADARIEPSQIRLIIITHGHVDHFANLPAMKKLTGAPVMCHKKAARYLENGLQPEVIARTMIGEACLRIMAKMDQKPGGDPPKVKPDIVIEGEQDLAPWGIPGKVIETPGHSDNCISVILPNHEAIIGDLFAAPGMEEQGVMACFMYPGARFEEVQESIEKLLNEDVDKFWLGHGSPADREFLRKSLEEEKNSPYV